ncbi:MAG: hypothetical protein ACMXYC_04590 [Candidatus Woesearchaeota archaeon]
MDKKGFIEGLTITLVIVLMFLFILVLMVTRTFDNTDNIVRVANDQTVVFWEWHTYLRNNPEVANELISHFYFMEKHYPRELFSHKELQNIVSDFLPQNTQAKMFFYTYEYGKNYVDYSRGGCPVYKPYGVIIPFSIFYENELKEMVVLLC